MILTFDIDLDMVNDVKVNQHGGGDAMCVVNVGVSVCFRTC